jgi:hypothetical protein
MVANIKLKSDDDIKHNRFKHNVDKGIVTGYVFKELEILDDNSSSDEEEEEEIEQKEELSLKIFNLNQKSQQNLQARGNFEFIDDSSEESSDDEIVEICDDTHPASTVMKERDTSTANKVSSTDIEKLEQSYSRQEEKKKIVCGR